MRLIDIELLQNQSRDVLAAHSPEDCYKKMESLIANYKVMNFEFGYEWPLWRARITKSEKGYANAKDLHYPPRRLVVPGRLNDDNNPLLYLSLNKFSTFAELNVSQGYYIHLAGYSLNEGHSIRCAIVGEAFNVHRTGRATLCDQLTRELNRILNGSEHRAALSWVYLDAFLANVLSDSRAREKEYLHSRAAANLIFSKTPDIDGIWYPGVALENGVNLAIKPDSADVLLSLTSTFVLKVEKVYEYGIFDFTVLRYADNFGDDGDIYWKQC